MIRVKVPRSPRSLLLLLTVIVLFIAPFFVGKYTVHVLIMSCTFAIFVMALNLRQGYGGLVSFGWCLPFGLGAYTAALPFGFAPFFARVPVFVEVPVRILAEAPLWSLMIFGGLIAAIICSLLEFPAIRLKIRGPYLAITTLAYAEIFRITAMRMWGEEGISYIPKLFGEHLPFYYFILILTIASVVIVYLIVNSRYGLRLRAISDDELAATSIGISTTLHFFILAFVSSFFAGVAGSFYTLYSGHIDPWAFSVPLTFYALSMLIVGGIGTIIGPVLGSFTLTLLSEYLRIFGVLRLVVYGLLLVVVLFFLPGGITGLFRKVSLKYKKIFKLEFKPSS